MDHLAVCFALLVMAAAAAPEIPSEGQVLSPTVWPQTLLLFMTAVPNTNLCAWGEEDRGGHVL